MPSYIKDNFEPDESTINKLRQEGIFKDFLDAMVTQTFREYWEELRNEKKAAGKKSAWQTTYRTWARRAFRGKCGREWEDRHKYQDRKGGLRNDLFEYLGVKITANKGLKDDEMLIDTGKQQMFVKGNKYKIIERNEIQSGEAMTPAEAFQQLSEILK